MKSRKVKVLYIAGWDRSGSTILDNMMGQGEGLFSVGELRYVWDRGLIENRLCGCGVKFSECPQWRGIFEQAFGGFEAVDAHHVVGLRNECDRLRYMLQPSTTTRRAATREYIEILDRLFLAMQRHSGAEVIVDSSKAPSHGYILQNLPSVELYIVHLTRDPRAVAFSWQRRKLVRDVPGAYMRTMNPLECSLRWNAVQVTAESLGRRQPDRYLNLRYEDLMKRPRESIARILEMMGRSPERLPFVSEHEILIKPVHDVTGNPNRFETGVVRLRPDDEWKRKMIAWQKLAVSLLTGPGLFRYGYRFLPSLE